MLARGSHLMDIHGVGPVVAARVLADVGDVTRFADRNRLASWTGTASLDASSGEQNRHCLSRPGNRRTNHMIHIAATSQTRLDTDGRAYFRPKRAEGEKSLESIRCLKARTSDATVVNSSTVPKPTLGAGPERRCGAPQESSAVDSNPQMWHRCGTDVAHKDANRCTDMAKWSIGPPVSDRPHPRGCAGIPEGRWER